MNGFQTPEGSTADSKSSFSKLEGKPETDVLFLMRNSANDPSHGGTRRTIQVIETLRKGGLKVTVAPDRVVTQKAVIRFAEGLPFFLRRMRRPPVSWEELLQVARSGMFNRYYRDLLSNYHGAVLMTENTVDSRSLIDLCVRAQRPVICIPHDIDAIGQGGISKERLRRDLPSLADELETFHRASRVFVISWESYWLLRNFHINASYFPYYPACQFESALRRTREARCTSDKKHFLLLGTAVHPPTRMGMSQAIEWIRLREPHSFDVVVAGFGTESLASEMNDTRVRVLGAVSESELANLLVEARAAIVHQPTGCGALTRIPELLLAGVPIIANSIAARNCRGMSGIYVYESADELAALMKAGMEVPAEPQRSTAHEVAMVHAVKDLLQTHRHISTQGKIKRQ